MKNISELIKNAEFQKRQNDAESKRRTDLEFNRKQQEQLVWRTKQDQERKQVQLQKEAAKLKRLTFLTESGAMSAIKGVEHEYQKFSKHDTFLETNDSLAPYPGHTTVSLVWGNCYSVEYHGDIEDEGFVEIDYDKSYKGPRNGNYSYGKKDYYSLIVECDEAGNISVNNGEKIPETRWRADRDCVSAEIANAYVNAFRNTAEDSGSPTVPTLGSF